MDDAQEDVILVDDTDREIGTTGKLDAHQRGVLHRAFSVMIWDRHGRLLLQQRAIGKYHSGGLWTNTCCGHPRPGESLNDAAGRRLQEEMGFTTKLTPLGSTIYRAALDRGLTEHEFVHVFRGTYDSVIAPDPTECDGYAWSTISDARVRMAAAPAELTAWFKIYLAAGWPVEPPTA